MEEKWEGDRDCILGLNVEFGSSDGLKKGGEVPIGRVVGGCDGGLLTFDQRFELLKKLVDIRKYTQ